jgi:hypothetical protein
LILACRFPEADAKRPGFSRLFCVRLMPHLSRVSVPCDPRAQRREAAIKPKKRRVIGSLTASRRYARSCRAERLAVALQVAV